MGEGIVPRMSTRLSLLKTGAKAWIILSLSILLKIRNTEGEGSREHFYLNASAPENFSVKAYREFNGAFDNGAGAAAHGEKSVKNRVSDMLAFFIDAYELRDFRDAGIGDGAKIHDAVIGFCFRNRVVSASIDLSVPKNGNEEFAFKDFAVVKGDFHGGRKSGKNAAENGRDNGNIIRHGTGYPGDILVFRDLAADDGIESDVADVGADAPAAVHGIENMRFSVDELFKVKVIFRLSADGFYEIVSGTAGIDGKACAGSSKGAVDGFIKGSVAAAGNETNLLAFRDRVFPSEADGVAGAFRKIYIDVIVPAFEKIADTPCGFIGVFSFSGGGIDYKHIIHGSKSSIKVS